MVSVVPALADKAATKAACVAPDEIYRLDRPLMRMAHRIAAGMPVTIVAIGSSSTEGAGASTPANSYPSRLAVELRHMLPRARITVINRGVGGETADQMLARFEGEVFAMKPDLVVWQVGSNSLLRGRSVSMTGELIRAGLGRLKASGADVILMNPQYAPKVFNKPDHRLMVELIDSMARESGVGVFQRFAVMQHWRLTEKIPFETFLANDELHMNDWSYACVARLLGGAIAEAATRPTMTATAGAGVR